MRPTFIGIGAQKSATTWLHKMFEEHPDIYVPKAKELHFFGRREGCSEYEQYFREATEPIAGEISTSYLSNEKAPAAIAKYNPQMKIILLVRDPIDRAISHAEHIISKGNRRLAPATFVQENPEIIEYGLYGKHLARYLNYFSPNQMFIGSFESVRDEPHGLLAAVYAFLEVSVCYSKNVTTPYNTRALRASSTHSMVNRVYWFSQKCYITRLMLDWLRSCGVSIGLLNRLFLNVRKENKHTAEWEDELRNCLRHTFSEDQRFFSELCRKAAISII